ncbi:hypothetical protein DFJ67_6545 [Asanoa ferruginea]|uniref:Uncharacterized protein n=1 Tax=Asanoa ferruginea TaxID=53367 RepID=A0A3E0A2I8_9ACTN|nr:hypothetical protein DFJ67_6545 [Asanoa ferruginea]
MVLASLLLAGTAVFGAIDVIATWVAAGQVNDAAPGFLQAMSALAVDDAPDWVDRVQGALNYSVAVAAGAIVVFAVLALVVRRRTQAARVAVWGAALLAVFLFGVGLANSPENFSPPDGSREVIEQAWSVLLPGWYANTRSLLITGELLTVVVASLALMRTSAGEFYRRQVAEPGLGAFLVERQGQQTD